MSKKIRMGRLFNYNSDKTFLLTIDNGITLGPIKGINSYCDTVKLAASGGVDAVIAHKGTIKKLIEENIYGSYSYIMHLSASTALAPYSEKKVLVTQVEEALTYGVDGISIHVNLGGEDEAQMLKDFGYVSNECEKWGIPLLAMMYAKGAENDPNTTSHLIKVAQEMGADIVKISYNGDLANLEDCISNTGIHTVLAGGNYSNNVKELLTRIDQAITYGFSGVAIGRNIFQSNHIQQLAKMISSILNSEETLEACLKKVEELGNDYF